MIALFSKSWHYVHDTDSHAGCMHCLYRCVWVSLNPRGNAVGVSLLSCNGMVGNRPLHGPINFRPAHWCLGLACGLPKFLGSAHLGLPEFRPGPARPINEISHMQCESIPSLMFWFWTTDDMMYWTYVVLSSENYIYCLLYFIWNVV